MREGRYPDKTYSDELLEQHPIHSGPANELCLNFCFLHKEIRRKSNSLFENYILL